MWQFGSQELIFSISALFTLLAIITSLYLATKSRTVKHRLYCKKINTSELKEKNFQKIMLLNTGHIKFTITRIGYFIDGKYYSCLLNSFLKKLNEPIKENNVRQTAVIDTDISLYLQEGESIEFYLYPKSFNFTDSKKNKRVYYFIMINDKVKKTFTGLRENEFYRLDEQLKQKAKNLQAGDESPKCKQDLFFRC